MIPDHDRPINAVCVDDQLTVTLANGRVITVPLTTYPSLLNATPEQRAHVQLSLAGLYWPELNVEISLLTLLTGSPVPPRRHKPRFCEG